jgi:gliding motility-associated-like protein
MHLISTTMFKKISYLIFLLILPISLNAQEVCDNGIDDDADGLIDLNDTDCYCDGFGSTQQVSSLIPNSSFEDYSCCPSSYSQLNCADGWIQASNPTSDFWHNCGTASAPSYGSPGPNPAGSGIAGFINWNGYKEYIGACLLQPMTAGNTYILDFFLGFGTGSVPIDISFYGTTTCADLPFTDGCPVGEGNWMQLASVTATGPGWVNLQVTFTPTVDINALVIGPDCAAGPSAINYYYLDGLTLAETGAFTSLNIDPTGDLCNNDYQLTASTDTSGGTWQWYQEGVALVGETNAVLDISGNNLTSGEYSAMYTIGPKCDLNSYVVVEPPYPTADFDNTTVCEGLSTTFTDQSVAGATNIVGWDWDFSSNSSIDDVTQNPTFIYGADGNFNATLTVTNDVGCSHDTTIQVTVHPNPETEFDFQNECDGFEIDFNNISQIASGIITSWAWDFGDATGTSTAENPSYLYGSPGQYNVELTATSDQACVVSYNELVTVYENPTADFLMDDVCDGDNYNFIDNSTPNEGNIVDWSWDFENDNIYDDNNQNPTHLYPNDGAYDATLAVTTDLGCSDTITQSVTVLELPNVDFTSTFECENDQTSFTDQSTTSHGTIAQWSWDFTTNYIEDDNTQNPNEVMGAAGNYSTTLHITTSEGCIDSITNQVVVNPLPEVDFDWDDVCDGNEMTFTDESTIESGNIVDWDWDFGDNNGTSNLQNDVYTYSNFDLYDVTLTLTSDSGCVDAEIHQVEVWAQPLADFDFTNTCDLSNLAFVSTSNSNGGVFDLYEWDVESDGNVDYTGTNGEHEYSSDGFFDLTHIVTTEDGCSDTILQEVTVYALPQADWSTSSVCEDAQTEFIENSTINPVDGDVITDWEWSFGDGNQSNSQNPTHQYASENVYDVELIISTNYGCEDTLEQTATVWPLPVVDFSPTDVCLEFETQFNDESTVSSSNTTNTNSGWDWDFGDGGTSTNQNPTYSYSSDGVFNATLTVTTTNGCINQETLPVTVHPKPEASFDGSGLKGCPTICPEIMSTSVVNNPSNIVNYEWTLSDGTIQDGSSSNYSNCFENNTSNIQFYALTLTVTTDQGCIDTHSESNYIEVYYYPFASFYFEPEEPDIINSEIDFTNTSSFADSYNWTFEDIGSSSDINPIIDYPDVPETYDVQLVALTDEGCTDTARTVIDILDRIIFYVPNTFTPDNDNFNESFQPVFTSGFEPLDFNLLIFNRWGEVVFESNDASIGWNGTYGLESGEIVKDGTYVWKLEFKETMSDKRHVHTGHVNVLK